MRGNKGTGVRRGTEAAHEFAKPEHLDLPILALYPYKPIYLSIFFIQYMYMVFCNILESTNIPVVND